MQVKIKRIDKSQPLPEYQTSGAVGFDLYAREDLEVKAHELVFIPTNLIIQTPPGYMLAVLPRSSTPKKGLLIPHGVGVIDQDYAGPEDEIKFQVLNFTDQLVKISRGERIAQGIFIKIEVGEFKETESLDTPSRGGFGSTGH